MFSFLIANFDYIPISSTLTFGPLHELEQCLQIEIIDDLLAEELEQLTVVLSTTSLAINITDREFQILIGPNDCKFQSVPLCGICLETLSLICSRVWCLR